MSINFDAEELVGKLNILERSQLPYAGRRAMFQLANILRTEAWPAYAQVNFENPVPYTTNGLIAKADGLTVTLSFDRLAKGGQDPARYLRPTSDEGPASVYVTRFSRYLRAKSYMQGAYALAITGNPALSNELDNGRVRRSFYQTLKSRLGQQQGRTKSGRKSRSQYADFRFFAVDENSADPGLQRFKSRPGIYRVKDGAPTRIFAFLDQEPSVRQKWSFRDFAEDESRKILPRLLKKALDEALR